MYEVMHSFTDLQDSNYRYNVGDTYPRDGLKVSVERLLELSSSHNRQKRQLIRLVVDNAVTASEPEQEETPEKDAISKTDINRMNKSSLVELALSVGIEGADEMSGANLKAELINYYNL